nr:MAG TPA: hypothetical protein [Caudoviricetes sp.]
MMLTILKREFCNEYEFDKTCKETSVLTNFCR